MAINDVFYLENFKKTLENLTGEALRFLAAEQDFILSITSRADVVLDLGCGTGRLTRLLAPSVCHITALDYSKVQLEQAAKSLARYNEKVTLVVGDARNPPLYCDQYDQVIMGFNTINSLNEPSEESQLEVLMKSNNLMRRRGHMILTAWAQNAADVQLEFYNNLGFSRVAKVTPEYVHVLNEQGVELLSHRSQPEKLETMLNKAGFGVRIEQLTNYSLACVARKIK